MSKVRIFISHATKDKDLAFLLQDVLKKHLKLASDEIFVSSKGTMSIDKPDTAQIINSHRQANVVIALMTPESVFRPWVVFETGGAILNKIPQGLFVVCAKGLTPKSLPAPIKHWHAGYLKDLGCIEQLVELLGKTLGFRHTKPDKDSAKNLIQEAGKGPDQWEFVDMALVGKRIGRSPFDFYCLLQVARKRIFLSGQNIHFLVTKAEEYRQKIFEWLEEDADRELQLMFCNRKKNFCVKTWCAVFGVKYKKHLDESTKTFMSWQEDAYRLKHSCHRKKLQLETRVVVHVPVPIAFIDPDEKTGFLVLKPVTFKPEPEDRPYFVISREQHPDVLDYYWHEYKHQFMDAIPLSEIYWRFWHR